MENEFINIPNDDKQNYPFCRLKIIFKVWTIIVLNQLVKNKFSYHLSRSPDVATVGTTLINVFCYDAVVGRRFEPITLQELRVMSQSRVINNLSFENLDSKYLALEMEV